MPGYRQAVMMEPSGRFMVAGADDNLSQRHPLDSTPFETHVSQRFPLGTILEDISTGRRWRYVLNGAGTLAPGKIVQSPVPASDHEDLAITTQAAGLYTVTVTNGNTTALTANMYSGGLLWINDGATGEGYVFRIKSHPAALVDATCVITLYDAIPLVLTNATHVASLIRSPYAQVIVHPSPNTAMLVGVPNVAVTAAYYFWAQTKGPCPVLVSGTHLIGLTVMPDAGTIDGGAAVYSLNSVDASGQQPVVGVVMRVGDDTDYGLVWLTLE